jgi:hypothetical protein
MVRDIWVELWIPWYEKYFLGIKPERKNKGIKWGPDGPRLIIPRLPGKKSVFVNGVLPVDEFWKRVKNVGGEGCWEWSMSRNIYGYGIAHHLKKRIGAHRLSWTLTNGEIPEGMQVLHKCDNPPCCRPDHLFLGTPLDNIHDAIMKERLQVKRGMDVVMRMKEKLLNPPAPAPKQRKLSDEQIEELRFRRRNGEKRRKLAEEFGIHPHQVWKICVGRSWSRTFHP